MDKLISDEKIQHQDKIRIRLITGQIIVERIKDWDEELSYFDNKTWV